MLVTVTIEGEEQKEQSLILTAEQIATLTRLKDFNPENAGTNAPLNHGDLAKESDLRALEKYVRFSRESELGPGQGNPKHPAELVSEMSESLGRDIEMAENRLEEKIQEVNKSIQALKEEIEALKKENQKLKEQADNTADSLWRLAVDLTIEPAKDGQPLLTESSLVRFGISRD